MDYRCREVLQLAERHEGLRGFTALDSNAVAKFPCGHGLAAHHGHGGLAALWRLQKAQLAKRQQATGEDGAIRGYRLAIGAIAYMA